MSDDGQVSGIRVRIIRVRVAPQLRVRSMSPVEYSRHVLTDWIRVPDLTQLEAVESAVETINSRRMRNPKKNDYLRVEVEWPMRIDSFYELKDLLNEFDSGFVRGPSEVI